MKKSEWQKFPVLFSLYIAQSIPMSFFSTVVPVIMRQENYSLESIGLLQLVKLPWIVKFLWAPIVDNRTENTRQLRQWIIVSELFYAAVILSIGIFSLQTDFRLIVVLMIVAFIASATQDIATDAFAILLLKPGERGLGNSMQSAGSFVGTLFGTGVLLIAFHYFGWTILLVLLAAFVILSLIPLAIYGNRTPVEKGLRKRVTLADIRDFFTRHGIHKRVLVLSFYYSGIIGVLAMLKPFLVDLGYSVKEIGFMSGIVGTTVAALSALLAGFIIKTIGSRKAMFIFPTVSFAAVSFFLYISHHTPSVTSLYTGICLLWGAYGLSTVAIYTTSMDQVRPGREGTDFTIQIVITHLSSLIIAIMSGKLGDLTGYTGLFGIEALLCILTFVILLYAIPKEKSNGSF
ncbi:MAG TPA: MFS transporter [Bacteroidales bacterium]|nr:MFS transporter [Bacteroidales bacterium]